MKIIEITNGLTLALSNEEAAILKKFKMGEEKLLSDLSEREEVVCNNLVRKDVLVRCKIDGKPAYNRI